VRCPFCGSRKDRVVDTRSSKAGRATRRRRECLSCGQRYTTYEAVELPPRQVVKRDDRHELYDRQKLLIGMVTACTKRPVNLETIEAAVDRIEERLEDRLEDTGGSRIESAWLGEQVMQELQAIDPVAYVRFASVYREFQDVTDFMEEVRELAEETPAPKPARKAARKGR
jgi:transcriptional repressor NrdR